MRRKGLESGLESIQNPPYRVVGVMMKTHYKALYKRPIGGVFETVEPFRMVHLRHYPEIARVTKYANRTLGTVILTDDHAARILEAWNFQNPGRMIIG